MLSTLDLPEMTPILSSSVFSSQSLSESLQPGLEGPSARDADKIPVGTFPPLKGSEFLGVGQSVSVSAAQPTSIGAEQSVSVSAAQSASIGVEQSVSMSAVQSVTEAAPSVGTLDINRTAGPTPGASEVPIPTTESQGNREPPDENRSSDFEIVPLTGEVVIPDIDSEVDDLICGQRLPSTRSSSPHDSSFEVIPDSDDNNNSKQRGVSSMPSEQVPVPPSASVGGGAVVCLHLKWQDF